MNYIDGFSKFEIPLAHEPLHQSLSVLYEKWLSTEGPSNLNKKLGFKKIRVLSLKGKSFKMKTLVTYLLPWFALCLLTVWILYVILLKQCSHVPFHITLMMYYIPGVIARSMVWLNFIDKSWLILRITINKNNNNNNDKDNWQPRRYWKVPGSIPGWGITFLRYRQFPFPCSSSKM